MANSIAMLDEPGTESPGIFTIHSLASAAVPTADPVIALRAQADLVRYLESCVELMKQLGSARLYTFEVYVLLETERLTRMWATL